jgi:2'-5' RNA ligase
MRTLTGLFTESGYPDVDAVFRAGVERRRKRHGACHSAGCGFWYGHPGLCSTPIPAGPVEGSGDLGDGGADAGGGDDGGMSSTAALDPATKPHQAATSIAQKELREAHPEVDNPLPYSEAKASGRLQDVLRAHGHPGADEAFVMRHTEPDRASSSVVHDADTGAVGVALHDKRYDYGTLAHEAGHILDIHRQGLDPSGHHSDDVVHGDGFRQGYHDALKHLFDEDVANTFTRKYRKHLRVMKDDPSRYRVTSGARTPIEGTRGTDNEGHEVEMTPQDGWAHLDGSHGHEDNTTIGDHPVYVHEHSWLPSGRYWGPNSGHNDQRLFEGEHLRPEIRKDILQRVGDFFDGHGYNNWPHWTKVYFAGSEAAQWEPFNGDFDILIGINWPHFRKDNPAYAKKNDLQVTTEMTDGLWKSTNVDDYYFTLESGKKVGPFDRTFFVNPIAWDISKLHPYAAYDVSEDVWAVSPLKVPEDWSAEKLPESYWVYAESLVETIKAIGTLPPEERHRMARNLWEELHTHRSDAFADGGHGLFDLSNVVEKYLDQHPDKPWDKLRDWKNTSPVGPEPWAPTTAARRQTLTAIFQEAATRTEVKDPGSDSGADYEGLMVALVPPKKICRSLALEGGEPVESMHVTLAYLGSKGEHSKDHVEALPDLVKSWASTREPLTATVGGVGTFVNPTQHVLWAAVDIPRGTSFRDDLVRYLEGHGYQIRHDHGWTPHVTLQYSKSRIRFLPKVDPMDWQASEVWVCVGKHWESFPLGG